MQLLFKTFADVQMTTLYMLVAAVINVSWTM